MKCLELILACIVVLFVVVLAGHQRQTDPGLAKVDQITTSAEDEIFYRPGDKIRFTCADENNTNIAVRWYINGLRINRRHMPAWLVLSVNFSSNSISLQSLPHSRPTSTLYCTIRGYHKWNVKRLFNLVKAIDRRPRGLVLSHHPMVQKCFLYDGKVLTLTCQHAIKYINVSRWQWLRNGKPYRPGHDSPELVVSRPGEYTCRFSIHVSLLHTQWTDQGPAHIQDPQGARCCLRDRLPQWPVDFLPIFRSAKKAPPLVGLK